MKGCGVYLIECPSGFLYIGSSKNLRDRYGNYKSSEYGRPIAKSIEKYGIEAHVFTVLEYCPQSDLKKNEVFYIHYLRSLVFKLLNVHNNRPKAPAKNAELAKELGKKMKAVRIANGDTIESLGRKIKMLPETIKKFESTGKLSIILLIRIVSHYHIKIELTKQ